jgi:hypothetical protein
MEERYVWPESVAGVSLHSACAQYNGDLTCSQRQKIAPYHQRPWQVANCRRWFAIFLVSLMNGLVLMKPAPTHIQNFSRQSVATIRRSYGLFDSAKEVLKRGYIMRYKVSMQIGVPWHHFFLYYRCVTAPLSSFDL